MFLATDIYTLKHVFGIKSVVFKIKISMGFTAVLFFKKRKLSIEKTANLLKLENLKTPKVLHIT